MTIFRRLTLTLNALATGIATMSYDPLTTPNRSAIVSAVKTEVPLSPLLLIQACPRSNHIYIC